MHDHCLGFRSFDDFVSSATGLSLRIFSLLDVLTAISLACTTIISGVEMWIWSPFYSLVVYFIVLIADFSAGVAVGVKKRHEGFLTAKAQRLPIIALAHLIILGIFFNLGRINHDLGIRDLGSGIFDISARTVYFYILGVNLMSFFKNLALLGYLPKKVSDFLIRYIDTHKNLSDPGAGSASPSK